jgi:polyribonucleotide nucleotidyltransferase
MMVYKSECVISGRTLSIEVGRMARQANGSAVVRFGDTVVFAAVTAAETPRASFPAAS